MSQLHQFVSRAWRASALPMLGLLLAFALSACLQDTGTPCTTDEDCVLGDLCLTEADGFPGGYCTTENCDVNGCPDTNSDCFAYQVGGQTKTICLQTCGASAGTGGLSGTTACTRAGYDCFDYDGEEVCLPSDGAGANRPRPGEVSSTCTGDADCDDGTCLLNFDGGYCSALCGSDTDCPSGSHCEDVGGQGYCYRDCTNNDECRLGYECSTGTTAQASCVPGDGRVTKNPNGADDGGTCASDINCKGGLCLREIDGYPGGYCTTLNCDNDNECNGGVCTLESANTVCRESCNADGDCRTGYTCVTGELATGGTGKYCTNPSAVTTSPGGGTLSEFQTGCGSSSSINFNISPGARGFFIAPYSEDGSAIEPQLMTGPGGVSVNFSGDYNIYNLNQDILVSITPLLFPGGDSATFLANRTDFGGAYTMTFNASSDVCYYIIESPDEGQVLDVNFYLVGVPGVDASSAGTNPSFQSMIGTMRTIYGNADINIGTVRYFELDAANTQRYSIIRDFNDVFRMTALSREPGPSVDERLSINVFLINDFNIPEVPGLLGISPGIPGLAGVHQTTATGLVFSSVNIQSSPEDVGQTMAHEIGHYLGLRHTTEHGGSSGDPIDDTPKCSDPQNGASCPDAENFMFPFSIGGVSQLRVSDGQSFVLKRSALVK